ncbi:MAG: heavy metal sensor histidine kinase [Planctomycetales bacterium]|nr:heavy metal sensor histidine kinase [Planctomycetales bacterium]
MSWKNETSDSVLGGRANAHPWSLAARLTVWYCASAFGLVVIATAILYWALVTNLDRQDDQFLIDEVHILRNLLAERPEYVDAIRQEVEWESAARRYARVYVRLLDADGRTIAETPGMKEHLAVDSFPAAVDETELAAGVDTVSSNGVPYRLLTARAARDSIQGPVIIQIAVDRVQHRALITKYRTTLLLVLIVTLAASSLVAFLIARRGIQPITEVTATARRIRSTTLHERITTADFPSELSALADTFNEMLDRLQESFERLSRFSADIAHELRTPVNNMRGEAEVALSKARSLEEYRDALGSCLEESVRLGRIIDGLLLMARAETPEAELQRETIDVASELAALEEFYEAAATETGVRLKVVAKPGVQIRVNRPLVQRAIGNLVENALAHTPAGGQVRVSVAEENGAVSIVVSDTGTGIPAQDIPHLFDRFYRVEHDRSSSSGGSGLGLAIVRSIAELHGGRVHLQSATGAGTTVTFSLPLQFPSG